MLGASSSDKTSIKYFDPEYLMDSAGSWNRYQAFQTSCFVLVVIFYTYGHYLPILYLHTPEHHCFIPGGEEWDLSQEDLKNLFIPMRQNESLHEKCVMYDVNVTEVLSEGIREPNPDWPVSKCKNSWVYDKEEEKGYYYNSVSTEFNFVCENSWKGPLTEAFYFIGSALGYLLNGWIGDQFGRYWSIVVSNCSMVLFGFILGFSPNYICFTVIRFIMGFFVQTGLASFFVISMECVSKTKRTFIGNFALGFGIFLAGIIMPGLLYVLKDWRLVNHALFAQGLLTIALPFTTHESIRWLLEREKYARVSETLEQIARFNGKDLDPNIISALNNVHNVQRDASPNGSEKETPSLLSLLKTKRLRKHFFLMLLCWSLITIYFESHLRDMRTLKVHVFYSFIFSNFLEFPAGLIVIWTMEWFGRRWSISLTCLFSSIALFISAYIKVMNEDAEWTLLMLSMFGRFCSSVVINVGLQFQFEILPTDSRSRGTGVILFSGCLSAFFSPYIIHSSRLFSILPQILMGLTGLLISALCMGLPETASVELPANLRDGEKFGKGDNFFYVPILNNRNRKSNI